MLQKAIQEQSQLTKLLAHIHALHRGHVDAERLVVTDPLQQRNDASVFDFALTNPYLQLVFFRVSQLNVIHVFEQFLLVFVAIVAAQVVARIQS